VAQENAPNKPVHLIYLCGGVLLFFVLQWTIDWLWGFAAQQFSLPPLTEITTSLVSFSLALICGIALYRSNRAYGMVSEVASELQKVTWPTAKEVRAATTVVIVMSIISAVILGFFDFVWSNLTELVYG
jgi:preprotein translocase subunit SecE